MRPVTIYLTAWCPFCIRAKQLLSARGIAYEAVDVDSDREKRAWLAEVTGQTTVPQIFFGEESIGGFSELASIDRSGQLRAKLSG